MLKVIKDEKYQDRYLHYAIKNLDAAIALFLSIEEEAAKGLMNIHALGEIINDEELMKDSIALTSLKEIHLEENLIRFYFDVFKEIELKDRVVWFDILMLLGGACCMTILMISIFTYNNMAKLQVAKSIAIVIDCSIYLVW